MAEFKDHFSADARGYAAFRPVYPPRVAELLASLSPARRDVLDVGAGSGQLSVVLAGAFERVHATDASAAQIAAATPHPRVTYAVAPAEHSGLPDRSLDCVVAAQAAHWFDLPRFYDECRRVLRPRGLVALVTYGLMEVTPEIDEAIARFYWKDLDGHWPPERRLVDEGYHHLAFPFDELAPPLLAMEQTWTLGQLVGYVETWSAVHSLRKSGGGPTVDRLARELATAWGSPGTPRVVRWPLSFRLGHV